MASLQPATGVLLSGGASRRMGTPKGSVRLGGTRLARRVAKTLKIVARETLQAGGPALPGLGWRCIPDRRDDDGPAAGIEAALAACDGPIVVCAVDLPFVAPGLLRAAQRAVRQGALAAAPHWGDRWHPLCGAYAPDMTGLISNWLDAGRHDLQELLDRAGAHPIREPALSVWDDPARLLFNINTPADLAKAEKLLGNPRRCPSARPDPRLQ